MHGEGTKKRLERRMRVAGSTVSAFRIGGWASDTVLPQGQTASTTTTYVGRGMSMAKTALPRGSPPMQVWEPSIEKLARQRETSGSPRVNLSWLYRRVPGVRYKTTLRLASIDLALPVPEAIDEK